MHEYVSRAGGERELEARAFAELQKSRRMEAVVGFLKDAAQYGASAALPFLQIMREQGVAVASLPTFQLAQQAIGYLALTVDEAQLHACLSGTPDELRDAVAMLLKLLDRLSRSQDELRVLMGLRALAALGVRIRSVSAGRVARAADRRQLHHRDASRCSECR
jgi:hypothetical protein